MEKARLDSLALADNLAKQKEETDRQQKLTEEREKQDSIRNAQKALLEQEEAARKAKILADIEAQKAMLGKANTVEEKVAVETPKVAAIPKIRDSDYKEGITEETVNELNRTIYRTVIKKDGTAFNYQKIVYTWGGIFYFKNDNSMTEILFDQEIKNARAELK
jgi:multidrug efflux pump subunit AcrA (membrane-fusion protein)